MCVDVYLCMHVFNLHFYSSAFCEHLSETVNIHLLTEVTQRHRLKVAPPPPTTIYLFMYLNAFKQSMCFMVGHNLRLSLLSYNGWRQLSLPP